MYTCSVTQLCLTLCDPMDCSLPSSLSMEFSGQEYWRGLPFPLQGIFLILESNPHLLRLLHLQVDSLRWATRKASLYKTLLQTWSISHLTCWWRQTSHSPCALRFTKVSGWGCLWQWSETSYPNQSYESPQHHRTLHISRGCPTSGFFCELPASH